MDPTQLVTDHQTSLYAFLYRMTGDRYLAEDLLQDTFVRALQASERYKPQGSVSSWLYSIAANLARDHWRKQRNRDSVPLGVGDGPASPSSAEDEALARSEIERLRDALLRLPFEQRVPLILFYYHDLSYEDISKCLVVPVGTVRSRIHNGKAKVRRLLEGRLSQNV